jgi:hypothetical protein
MSKKVFLGVESGAITLFAILLCGCLMIPLPTKQTSRHAYSKEAIAFLDLPDATRAEVLSTLGPPVSELTDVGVLVYTWELTSRFLVVYPSGIDARETARQNDLVLEGDAAKVSGASQMWVLFIACDHEGKIVGHQISKLNSGDTEQEGRAWHRRLKPTL